MSLVYFQPIQHAKMTPTDVNKDHVKLIDGLQSIYWLPKVINGNVTIIVTYDGMAIPDRWLQSTLCCSAQLDAAMVISSHTKTMQ